GSGPRRGGQERSRLKGNEVRSANEEVRNFFTLTSNLELRTSIQIEQQELPCAREIDPAFIGDGHAVARLERSSVDRQVAAGRLQPAEATRTEVEAQHAVYSAAIEIDVLIDLQRSVARVVRGDELQSVRRRKRLLLVSRRDSVALRQEPDLIEVHRLGLR